MQLLVFFTYGVSLKVWAETGLLQREVRYYTELIDKYGIEVTFITYGDTSDRQWQSEIGSIQLSPVYEKLVKFDNRLLSAIQTLLIPFVFKQEIKKSHIIKTNQIIGGWVAVLCKWFYRKPLLIRCGYEAYKNRLHENKRSIKTFLLSLNSWLCYRNADHIWLNTDEISSFVQTKFKIRKELITTQQNWIDTVLFSPKQNQTRIFDRVLFVGRLSKEKNLHLLIESLKKTNIGLDVIGDGPQKENLQQVAKNLSIDIKFFGRIPNDQIPQFYQQYAVYVLCSRYEGNPKTLLEAMACGCVVIGTAVPGIREIIHDQKTGLLVDETPESLRKTILQVLNDRSLCDQLSHAARIQVIENNSLHAMLEKEYVVYRALLSK